MRRRRQPIHAGRNQCLDGWRHEPLALLAQVVGAVLELEIAPLAEGAYQLFGEEGIALAAFGRDVPQPRAGRIGLDLRVYQDVDVLRAERLEADLTDAAQLQIAPRDGKARGHQDQERQPSRLESQVAQKLFGRRVEPMQVLDDEEPRPEPALGLDPPGDAFTEAVLRIRSPGRGIPLLRDCLAGSSQYG